MTTAICQGCTVPAEMMDGNSANDEHGYLCSSCMQATIRVLAFSLHWHNEVQSDQRIINAFNIVIGNLSQEFGAALAQRRALPPIKVKLSS